MKTIVQTIDPESFQDEELQEACKILQNGGLVAFPTETVYGLGEMPCGRRHQPEFMRQRDVLPIIL